MSLTSLTQKHNWGQCFLGILFILYLILGTPTPPFLALFVDSIYGKAFVLITALSLFVFADPIVAVLGIIVALDFIRRSSIALGGTASINIVPSDTKKNAYMQYMSMRHPYSLEQEMVSVMAPVMVSSGVTPTETSYLPTVNNTNDAAPVNFNGIS